MGISKVYPDPFTDRFTINFFNTASTNDISISVSDLNGRSIYKHRAGKLTAGNNTLTVSLDGSYFSDGICLVTLYVNGIASKSIPLLKTGK
ncbi:MAG: T9SS type A sorting domain-containing protein [Chitinophagaceae bacterium]